MQLMRLLGPAALLAALSSGAVAQNDVWTVNGGRVSLFFHEANLAGAGLRLVDVELTAPSQDGLLEFTETPLASFGIEPTSDLLFLTGEDAGFVPYGMLGGTVRTVGGFTLASPSTGLSADFHEFLLHPFVVRNDGPGGSPDPDYFAISAIGPAGELDNDLLIRNVKIQFDLDGNPYEEPTPGDHALPLILVKSWDLVMSAGLAAKLGRPELAGLYLADGKVEGTVVPWDGRWEYPQGQNPFTPYTGGAGDGGAGDGGAGDGGAADAGPGDAAIDVKLGLMGGITQLGHAGLFGSGRAGLSMSTTSCNNGTSQVTWLAAMNENHPGIAMQVYRQKGNRFEQVGASWIKHGFFALANSQCTPCQGGSAQGKFLGIGCSDTYGTSNNGNRFWLGPRGEWNAFTAQWTCLGSYFDGSPVDCIRDEDGNGLNTVDHRLEAFDADLNQPGATYFYEAVYMVRQDEDLTNNIGSRQCLMVPNGSNTGWSFSTPSTNNALLQGPAIDRYGELRTQAGLGPADGNVILAVQTTDLGNGEWRYEYALFNWNLDRQVRAFSVPTGAGSASDFYFHDIDDQPSNDWVPAVSAGNLTWTFPDVFLPGHKVGGPLEYATLYNFGFTSDVAPGSRNAALTIHAPGPGGDLLGAATLAPAGLNLSATKLAPAPNEPFSLVFSGGTESAMVAVMSVGGVPLAAPVLLGPLPFVAGTASIPLAVPVELAGLSIGFLGGEVTTSPLHLVQFTNSLVIDVQ